MVKISFVDGPHPGERNCDAIRYFERPFDFHQFVAHEHENCQNSADDGHDDHKPHHDEADELRRELVAAGCEQLVRCLAGPLPTPTPQVGEPLYAAKITPDDLRIRWAQGAQQIDRVIRLGGAWTTFREKRVKVLSATLDSSARVAPCPVAGLTLQSVQPEGKGPMPFADFARGARPAAAEWFV